MVEQPLSFWLYWQSFL